MSEQEGLKKGLTTMFLWSIGVGMVISGDYFGWNFAVAEAGYVGMLIAVAMMAVMYTSTVLSIAEVATVMPHTGGAYGYARRTMGPLAGFLTGVGCILEYFMAAPVVAIGIGGYINFLWPSVSPVAAGLVIFAIVIIIHFMGINGYASLETVLVFIALGLLVLMYCLGLPHIDVRNLFGENLNQFIPGGLRGVWAALPYGMWLFLGIEMLPTLAEECRDPKRDLPKGLIYSMVTLLVLACLTVTVVVGLGGMKLVGASNYPLPEAVASALGNGHWLTNLLAVFGLFGLLASFSGLVLAYSRPIFALSRAGYFPKFLSNLNKRQVPHWALIVPSIIGVFLILFFNADDLMLISTFGALISYISMNLSVLLLRRQAPNLTRPFKTPLYPLTPVIAIILAVIALFASFLKNINFFFVNIAIFVMAVIYYYAWAKNNINEDAPEERFAREDLAQHTT